jgi:hypothetical protein
VHSLTGYIFEFYFILLYYCIGGTLWHLQKFLTIYHSSVHLLHHSPLLPPPPNSWNSFNMSHFFHLHTCVYNVSTIFVFLQPFLISSPPPMGTNPKTGPILPSCSLLMKKDHFVCLRYLHGVFPCDIPMYTCIITSIGLSPLFQQV